MMRGILSVGMLAVTLLLSLLGLLFLTESWLGDALSVASAAMLIALLLLGVWGAWTVAMGRRPTLKRHLPAVAAFLSLVFGVTAAEHARNFQRFSAAQQLAAQLQAHLHRQKRFSRIDVDASTSGGGGTVCVSGEV
jgi:cell division protein FtsB